jgi:hypothetical protein
MLKREFITRATQWQKEQPKIFDGVMLEFKEKKLINIAPQSRRHFLTLMEKRSPKPYMPIYSGVWRDSYGEGHSTKQPGEQYGAVKNDYGYARK